jgi:hypothetical protein
MDFHPGDVDCVDQSMPHHVESIGDHDLAFLEVRALKGGVLCVNLLMLQALFGSGQLWGGSQR